MLDATAKILFDSKRTFERIERKETSALYRAGGRGMRTLRNLLSRHPPKGKATRAKHRAARKPPYRHTGLLRRFSIFAVDETAKTLDVGVAKRKTKGPSNLINHASVPQLLDEGGKAKAMRHGEVLPKIARYRPHPFLQQTRDKSAELLAQIVEQQGLL